MGSVGNKILICIQTNTHIKTSMKPKLNQLDKASHRAQSKPKIKSGRVAKRMSNTLQHQGREYKLLQGQMTNK